MFQKVSNKRMFLFEVWESQGFLIPAPAAFNESKDSWKARGVLGEKEFELTLKEEHVGKDSMGGKLPVPLKDGMSFKIDFFCGEEKDSLEGKIRFL